MGEIADMMLDGSLCSSCGEVLGGDEGYPVMCNQCESASQYVEKQKTKQKNIAKNSSQKKTKCAICGKKVKEVGLKDHQRDAHEITS